MATRVLKRPGLKKTVAPLHEQVALVALAAIAIHGLALLGDKWLKPGWRGISVPFAMSYRPGFTGVGTAVADGCCSKSSVTHIWPSDVSTMPTPIARKSGSTRFS